jgi:hypothetical protein
VTTPEQIQADIEGTRRSLSSDVDRLAEKVSPGRVVGRRVDRVKSGVSGMRERVMGAVPDPSRVKDQVTGTVGDTAGSVADSAKDAAGTAKSAVAGAPSAVRQQAQGSPLAAGLVAFGVGLIVSSLVPASDREKQLAAKAEEAAVPPLQEKAKEVAGDLQGTAMESAQQVKEAAGSAASQTADEARSAAEQVKAPLQQ